MLPLFATCQEIDPKTVETVIHEEEITVVDYKYVDAFTKKEYSIITVPSLEKYVGQYFKFLEKYNLDIEPIDRLACVVTSKNYDKLTENEKSVGITFKAIDSLGIGSSIFFREDYVEELSRVNDSTILRFVVFHEMTHAITNNRLPHCSDYVNCSTFFFKEINPDVYHRITTYSEMEEYKLASMIRLFQRFPPQNNYLGIKEEE